MVQCGVVPSEARSDASFVEGLSAKAGNPGALRSAEDWPGFTAWHTEHHVAANCSPLRTSALPLLAPHKAIRMNTGKGVIARKLMRQHYNRHSPNEARIAPLTRLLQRQIARRRASGDRSRRRARTAGIGGATSPFGFGFGEEPLATLPGQRSNFPIDRFLEGKADALSLKQQAGLALFMDKGCLSRLFAELYHGHQTGHGVGSIDEGKWGVCKSASGWREWMGCPRRIARRHHRHPRRRCCRCSSRLRNTSSANFFCSGGIIL